MSDELLCAVPRIVLVKKFLSGEEVSKLLALAEGKWTPSTVVDNASGQSVSHEHRTGFLSHIGSDSAKEIVVQAFNERAAAMTGTRVEQGESLQLVKYQKGHEYQTHHDWFDPKLEGHRVQMKKGGQRIKSVIACLRDAVQGGETEFPRLKVKVKLEPGDALIFDNYDAYGKSTLDADHAGCPVLEGEKVVAVQWIRERAFDGSEEKPELDAQALAKKALDDAKILAKKAMEDAQKIIKEEQEQRTTACFEEIKLVLAKHRCQIYAKPMADVDQKGFMRIGATVELDPME